MPIDRTAIRDAIRISRERRCWRNHLLTVENAYIQANGHWSCRICIRMRRNEASAVSKISTNK